MNFHIITIFPEMFTSYLGESIIARAIKEKKITVSIYDPRDYTKDKYKKVDNIPYGGGPGMVMTVDPIARAVKKVQQKIARRKIKGKVKMIMTSPSGKEFTNKYADKLLGNKYSDVIIIWPKKSGDLKHPTK